MSQTDCDRDSAEICFHNSNNTLHIASKASSPNATPSSMHFFPDSPSSRIQRWIGKRDPSIALRDSEEVKARQQHDNVAELDWELEEFEREMALRFVMRDLELDLEERKNRAILPERKRTVITPQWLRTQSSTATLQPLTNKPSESSSSSSPPPPHSLSPAISSSTFTPALSCPEHTSSLIGFIPTSPSSSSPSHKPSPSVLSLSSHFSSCTSSLSHDTAPETDLDLAPNASARSLVSHFGRKIKNGILPPSSYSNTASTTNPYKPNTAVSPPLLDLLPSGQVKKKRRVSVPATLAAKKKRLIVRGVRIDDDYAVNNLSHWACKLGEVSRICRASDGTLWIEFRDRRVAENVCRLQAQVYIPNVGRVVLDWAEGRHPG